jgi:hypothetical protein
VTRAYGSVTSTVAALTVLAPFITGVARNADGTVTLSFVTPANITAQLWSATNLTPPIPWQPIFTNNSVGLGAWQFTDTNTVNYPETFYRISIP